MAWQGALETTLALPLAEAESLVRTSLSRQGFGVLTEIDVQATLQAKPVADQAVAHLETVLQELTSSAYAS